MGSSLSAGAVTAARSAPPGDHFPTPGRRGQGDPWQDDALCSQMGPEIWEDPGAIGTAQHLCRTHCFVLLECRRWARDRRWHECVVGGMHYAPKHDTPTAKPQPTLASRLYVARRECMMCQNPEA